MRLQPFVKMTVLLAVITIVLLSLSIIPKEPLFLEATKEDIEMTRTEKMSLQESIDHILEQKELAGSLVGLTVKHATDGDVLFSHQEDIRLHPASNMKLLTGAAALETLGEDFRFQTEILTDGKQIENTLHGNLYIKGKGDPALLKSDLDDFASELKALGIDTIDGNLVGDDTWYDDIRLSQDLNWSDEPFHTGAQISALSLSPNEDYDVGTVIVEVTQEKTNEGQADIRVIPETDYVTLVNQTKIVPSGEPKQITVEREHGTNQIMVKGNMPEDSNVHSSWVSVWEPTGYVLSVFRNALADKGIQFTNDSIDTFDSTPPDASILTTKESIPLSELLIPFMKLSNNGIAEGLTKEMGKQVEDEGTWDAGLRVMEDVMEKFGIDREAILLRDGSGMSHKTLITSSHLAHLLYEVQDKDWFETFKNSLPVAGESDRFIGGTLRHRLTAEPAKGNIIAKTGLITGVSTLSGYVTTQDGEELIFAILINNHLGPSEVMQEIENQLVETLAEHEF